MKKRLLPLSCLLLLLFLAGGFSINTQAQTCDSYCSEYPPPYPDDYPCMDAILSIDSYCCDVQFDEYCIQLLKDHCAPPPEPDGTVNLCLFGQCKSAGCTVTPFPFCPTTCPSYATVQPPPGPNPPEALDGILFEMFWYDGYCCQDAFDNLCYDILYDINTLVCDDGDPTTINGCSVELGCTFTPECPGAGSKVRVKAFFEGPYNPDTDLMETDLLDNGLLPLNNPFSADPWCYTGGESVADASSFPPNVVDWIMVEVRDFNNTAIVLDQRVGFLRNDGILVDVLGNEGLGMPDVTPGTNYYVALRSRNHLDVLSAFPVYLSNTSFYDFTDGINQAAGANQQSVVDFEDILLSDVAALRAGDMKVDGYILVSDFNNFYLPEASAVSNYLQSDLNMDGSTTVADFNLFQKNGSVFAFADLTDFPC